MRLKRCPFCNGSDPKNEAYGAVIDPTKGILHWVECKKCGADGPEAETRDKAEENWNRRDG